MSKIFELSLAIIIALLVVFNLFAIFYVFTIHSAQHQTAECDCNHEDLYSGRLHISCF